MSLRLCALAVATQFAMTAVCGVRASDQGGFRLLPDAPGLANGPGGGQDAFFDFDRDGDLDYIARRAYREFVGSGEFLPGQDFTLNWQVFGTVSELQGAGGDVDGDGTLDLVFAERTNLILIPPRVLLGDGSGGFAETPTPRFPSSADWLDAATVALVDLDQDGDLDAVCSRFNGQDGCRVAFNNGSGLFSEDPSRPGPSGFLASALSYFRLADLNADRRLDLVLMRNGGNPYTVLFNNGDGTLTPRSPFLQLGEYIPAFGDMDGDGDVDVAMFGGVSVFGTAPPPIMFVNDGAGNFTRDSTRFPDNLHRYSGCFVDFDADGDEDMVVGYEAPPPSASVPGHFRPWELWINDGTGHYSIAPEHMMPLVTDPQLSGVSAFDVGDIDGDGDLDVPIVSNRVGTQFEPIILWNTTRHLYAPKVAEYDPVQRTSFYHQIINAPPGNLMALMVGFAGASVVIPGHGTLSLDPTFAFVVPPITMPASGEFRQSIEVPTSPAFAGLPLHWQAVDVDPANLAGWKLMAAYAWESVL